MQVTNWASQNGKHDVLYSDDAKAIKSADATVAEALREFKQMKPKSHVKSSDAQFIVILIS